GRVVEGEQVVHLVVRTGKGADRTAGCRALTEPHFRFLNQSELTDLLYAYAAQCIGLAKHQRVALQAHQSDVPDVLPVLQSDLPTVAPGLRLLIVSWRVLRSQRAGP